MYAPGCISFSQMVDDDASGAVFVSITAFDNEAPELERGEYTAHVVVREEVFIAHIATT